MDVEKVKAFWQARAAADELAEGEVTHRDIWQRWLEIETIKKFVGKTDRVLDVGCGNGFTTKRLAPLVSEIVGMDYSEEMIRRAQKDVPAGASFKVASVTELSPATAGMFTVVVSERCLINLASWEHQKQALANIASVIRPGGRFIFVEGCKDGRDNLNRMRQSAGLQPMPPVWHNIDFERQPTLDQLSRWFDLEHDLHFGVYDFVARVVHPLVVAPEEPRYDSRINEVGAKLACQSQQFGGISRVLFLVLRRRPDSR